MPLKSEKTSLVSELENLIRNLVAYNADKEEIEDLIDLQEGIKSSRFLNLREYETRDKSINDLLWRLDDKEFKQEARLNVLIAS